MARRYWNTNLEEMLEAGVHFGHGTRKWNPRMAPYIFAKRKGIHITNLTRTVRFLLEACDLVFDAASKEKQLLIVGTKNKAADLVAQAAIRAWRHYKLAHYRNELHKFRDLRTEQKMGGLNHLLKRDTVMLKRQLSRLQTYLGGIKYIMRLPNIVIIVDQQEEYTALRESSIRLILNKLVVTIFLFLLKGNMNGISNALNGLYDIFDIEVGQHFYWQIAGFQVHAQVLITSWVVIAILLGSTVNTVRNRQTIPTTDISKTQIGEEYGQWVPFSGTIKLAAPTNDINTTVALALLTSVAYFYVGLSKKGLGYFSKYIQPTPILLPINILEDFTKPL
ncbi:hypothetical protein ERO13_D08G103720v2 [Gossypium hirsutum]|nr:hypothetical protein ERO13_D08G103720v2 [Gossypium hirsutum]